LRENKKGSGPEHRFAPLCLVGKETPLFFVYSIRLTLMVSVCDPVKTINRWTANV